MRIKFSLALAMLALLISMTAAAAQQPAAAAASVDSRWTPWLGCWRLLEDAVNDEIDPDTLTFLEYKPADGVIVCVTPSSKPSAVTLTTTIEKQSAMEETMFADGSDHPITELGCQGAQRAEWSSNGRRLFAKANLSCSDGTRRSISGLTAIGPRSIWVDIQVVTQDGRESIRVRRYQRASDQSRVAGVLSREQLTGAAVAAARQATSLSLDEVKEANAKVSASALEAVLVETKSGFPLNAKRLQELDAAGVPDRVLDLMIALSFPNRFVVERRASTTSTSMGGADYFGPMSWLGVGYDSWPYYYSPFAYGLWSDPFYYGYYSYGVPSYIVPSSPSEPGIQPSGRGRVVDGQGYTRVRSREPETGGGGSSSGSGGGMSTTGSSSGGGGGVSTQGYSGGGGGGGRTAQPRPPQ